MGRLSGSGQLLQLPCAALQPNVVGSTWHDSMEVFYDASGAAEWETGRNSVQHPAMTKAEGGLTTQLSSAVIQLSTHSLPR